ncbi:MAG: hypothetical protein ACLQHF_17330 [Terracidiphilus sp.]
MGVNPKAGGGGSMFLIIVTVVIVAGAAIYLMDPYLFQNIITTIARWLRFGH